MQNPPGSKVLIVDDDPDVRDLIADSLRLPSASVDCAASGVEFMKRIQNGSAYDLILLDISMPGMDGISALRLLRDRKDPARYTPVMIISGSNDQSFVISSSGLDVSGFVVKPFLPQDLATRVGAIIGHALESTEIRGILMHLSFADDSYFAGSSLKQLAPAWRGFPVRAGNRQLGVFVKSGLSPRALAKENDMNLLGGVSIFELIDHKWQKIYVKRARNAA